MPQRTAACSIILCIYLEVGDLVGCGISHPGIASDKWLMLPLVDDDYVVTGAIETYF